LRSLTSGAKRVSAGEFPHSSEKLGEATSEDSHPYDDVGRCNPASLNIDEGKNEGCRSESKETAGREGRSSAIAKGTYEAENSQRTRVTNARGSGRVSAFLDIKLGHFVASRIAVGEESTSGCRGRRDSVWNVNQILVFGLYVVTN
jgi:hypothetical protein